MRPDLPPIDFGKHSTGARADRAGSLDAATRQDGIDKRCIESRVGFGQPLEQLLDRIGTGAGLEPPDPPLPTTSDGLWLRQKITQPEAFDDLCRDVPVPESFRAGFVRGNYRPSPPLPGVSAARYQRPGRVGGELNHAPDVSTGF